jgi:hypothetical protein
MGSRQTSDRHTIRGAGHVIEAGVVAERHAARLTAMLAAYADLEPRLRLTAIPYGPLDQLAHALGIEHLEGIVGQQPQIDVLRQEAARIVAAEAEGGLREIVGAEREEVGLLGDLVAVSAARGSSIMVPMRYGTRSPITPITCSAARSMIARWCRNSLTSDTSGTMISGRTSIPRR